MSEQDGSKTKSGGTSKFVVVALLVVAVAFVLVNKSRRSNAPEPQKPAMTGAASLPKMIEFGSTTCTPCKMMEPVLDELRRDYSDRLHVEFVDTSKNGEAAGRYRIKTIPTQIFFDPDGNELWRHQGFIPVERILARWKELGFDFGVAEEIRTETPSQNSSRPASCCSVPAGTE